MVGTIDTGERPALSERDRAILDFEHHRWKYAGAKQSAVLAQFGMSATRYYQVLNALIDHPEALAYDAQLVARLARIRDGRRAQRAARRSGQDSDSSGAGQVLGVPSRA